MNFKIIEILCVYMYGIIRLRQIGRQLGVKSILFKARFRLNMIKHDNTIVLRMHSLNQNFPASNPESVKKRSKRCW